jgi:hypothetical protein
MVKYIQIKDNILSLSRPDQYKRLLETLEWLSFRRKIIEFDNNRCQKCDKTEGLITAPAPIDEYRTRVEEVTKYNNEFKRKLKDPLFLEKKQKIWAGLINEPHEGLMPYPADSIIVGEIILQVHHQLYFFDKLPWEYDRKHLQTLCSECHTLVHLTTKIYCYWDDSLQSGMELQPCIKCNGQGYLPQYMHVSNGICFRCGGEGVLYPEKENQQGSH